MSTRDSLLLLLKKEKGNWVSGEQLRQSLSVSRNAVSKQVRVLKSQGYLIESAPRKGYRMQENTELLLPREIREGLETKIFGQQAIEYFSTTSSTNLVAKDLALDGAAEGTLVLAELQTKGKSRKSREWFSSKEEGIYLSMVARPKMPPIEASRLSLMTAVAAAEAIRKVTDLDVKIKWPNDLLVAGKKMTGIITEISTDMESIDYVVIGIGINVNIPQSNFPEDLREIATSLQIETGKRVSRLRILQEFLTRFETYYLLLQESDFEPILKKWKENTDILGREILVDVMGRKYQGIVKDIDHFGVLILEDADGKKQRVISGDVNFV